MPFINSCPTFPTFTVIFRFISFTSIHQSFIGFGRSYLTNTTRTLTQQPVRCNRKSVQSISIRADDTSQSTVDSSWPIAIKPPVNCLINNRDIDHFASVNRLFRLRQIPDDTATPKTSPRTLKLVLDPRDALSARSIRQPSLHF